MRLRWLVADTLTGRLSGRLPPSEWRWHDPLAGFAEGQLTIRVPRDANKLLSLQRAVTSLSRQILAQDETGRIWFGGPITADPEMSGDQITVSFADWRKWFYAAPLLPDSDTEARGDYIRTGANEVDQNTAITDIADEALSQPGAPRMVVDSPAASGIDRAVTFRQFTYAGEAMDNIAERERGPDWWTYLAVDPADPRDVVAHLTVASPERTLSPTGLMLRHQVLRHQEGRGGNILDYDWPAGNTPFTRVAAVSQQSPPAEQWGIAEDPGIGDGEKIAWTEVWRPQVETADGAFEHAFSRLASHGSAFTGVAGVKINPTATDLGSWGPGDRARLVVADGWRDVDLPATRILSRTLAGRGPHVLSVEASLDLAAEEPDIDEPEEVNEDEGE